MNINYITISQINEYIKAVFDNNNYLKKVYLKGEISNFKQHTTGHLYLTLKDDNSRISAIMFRSAATKLLFKPEDGMNVLVSGRISVYPIGGSYQIYIDTMEQDGLGNLYVKYEELKRKLASEGLFSKEHKRPIPKYPSKVGIVTAPTGAAIKDILSTIKRRFPLCETILFPALVQGISAAPSVAKQIEKANNYDIDVLIVGRGGGSIEDLWAFNEEIVAHAIYNSRVPVISAVGHEVDFTIADYVADLRAPTPTGAAEMAVPTISEVKTMINSLDIKINSFMKEKLDNYNHILAKLKESYVLKNPTVLYDIKTQKLDNTIEMLEKNIKNIINTNKLKLDSIKNNYTLNNPLKLTLLPKNKLEELKKDINNKYKYIIDKKDSILQLKIQALKLVNPLNILDKGYSVVLKEDKTITSKNDVKIKDKLDVRLKDGIIKVEVKEI